MKLNFSTRISLYTLSLASILFVITLSVVFFCAKYYLHEETLKKAEHMLDLTNESMCNVLNNVETAHRNTIFHFEHNIDNSQIVLEQMAELLQNNTEIFAIQIGLEPYYFRNEKYTMFLAYREDSTKQIEKKQITNKEQYGDYLSMDWFQLPYYLEKPLWSDPYQLIDDTPVISYLSPIRDKNNRVVGSIAMAIRLVTFTDLVEKNEKVMNHANLVVGRRGGIIISPMPEHQMRETIFTLAEEKKDTTLWRVGLDMIAGKSGVKAYTRMYDDKPAYLLYQPVEHIGWSIGLVIPEGFFMSALRPMTLFILMITVLGLVIMYLSCFWVIRKLLNPIKALTETTKKIANGDFCASLPQLKREDEIKELCDVFEHMQQSLSRTIESLVTEKNKAEYANYMRSTFIQNFGRDIRSPLNNILGFSYLITEMANNKQENLKDYSEIIAENCQTLCNLLKELMNLSDLETNEDSLHLISYSYLDVCHTVMDEIKEKDTVRLEFIQNIDNKEEHVFKTDPMQIEKLLIHLIKYSIKLSENGLISLVCSTKENPGKITFSVCYQGKKMSKEYSDNLFTYFDKMGSNVLEHKHYNALTLYICNILAKRLKCEIKADTNYKNGNRFVVIHPY